MSTRCSHLAGVAIGLLLTVLGGCHPRSLLPPTAAPPPAPSALPPTLRVEPERALPESGPFELVLAAPTGALTEPPRAITLVFSRAVQPIEGSISSDVPVATVTRRDGTPLDGDWIWYGTRTAVFTFPGGAPWASELEVVVPADTAALDGARLGADRAFAFSTPPPTLLQAWVPEFEPRRGYRVECSFNQPVAATEVLRSLTVTGRRGRTVVGAPFRLEDSEQEPGYASRSFVLRVPRVPPGATAMSLVAAQGLRGAEGPLTAATEQRLPLPELDSLRISLDCVRAPDQRCTHDSSPALELSKPVPALALYQHLRFDPPVPKDRYDFEGTTTSVPLWALFEPKPGGRYRVDVLPGFAAEDGEPWTRAERFVLEVADEPPSVRAFERTELLFPSGSAPAPLRFWGTNIVALDAVLAPWPRSTAPSPLAVPAAEAFDAVLALGGSRAFQLRFDGARNEETRQDLQLPPELVPSNQPGSYLLATRAEGVPPEAARRLTVTDLGVVAKWSARGGLVWVTRLSDATPVEGARIRLANADGDGRPGDGTSFRTTTDERGLAELPAKTLRPFARAGKQAPLVTVTVGSDRATVALDRLDADELQPVASVFVERGVYQPGESIYIKGYVREPGPEGYQTPMGKRLEVLVRDENERVLLARRVQTDDYGSFSLEGTLPESAPLGYASVEARWNGRPLRQRGRGDWFRIERYRVLDFEVQAALDRRQYVRGDTATLAVLGRYIHGTPMRDVPVQIEVTQWPVPFSPPGLYEYRFGSSAPREGTNDLQAGRMLDAQGRARLVHTLSAAAPGSALSLEFTVEVHDVGHRFAITDSAEALLHPGELYLGLRPDEVEPRYPGHPIGVDLIAATPDGTLREGVTVTATLVPPPDDAPPNGTGPSRSKAAPPCTVVVGATPGHCTFTPRSEGTHRVVARATDSRGNPIESEIALEVLPEAVAEWRPPQAPEPEPEREPKPDADEPRPGESFAQWCRRQRPAKQLDVVRPGANEHDWERHELGDRIALCVLSPAASSALVTLERDGIARHRIERLAAGGNLRRLEVSDAFYPRAKWTVTAPRPAAESRNVSETASLLVEVGTARKDLEVKLDTPARRRPGGQVRVRVRVTRNGKPTAAQVTLWAVDQGVLALGQYSLPEPLRAFADRSPAMPRTFDTRSLLYEPLSAYRARAPSVRCGSTQAGDPGPLPVRERFPAVAWYRPDLRLDASGTATLDLPLPDNATRWHVFAVAATRDDAFGGAERTFTTTQPLLLRPQLPRALRVGDRFRAAVVLDSTLARTIDVELTASAAGVVSGRSSRVVRVPARGHAELELPLVATRPGRAELTFTAVAGRDRDAVRVERRVVRPTSSELAVIEGVADPVAWERIGALSAAGVESGRLELTLASSPLVGLGEVARSLEQYPYGCTEQLVSSLVPSLLLQDGGRRLGVESRLRREDVERALSTLISRQQRDGSFGYWTGSTTGYPWLTGYALLALLRAREAGLPVAGHTIAAARAALERGSGDADPSWVDAVWREDVLATAGAPRREALERLAATPEGQPLFGLALLAHGLARAGAPALGRQRLEARLGPALELAGATAVVRDDTRGAYSAYLSSTTRDTAVVVRALAAVWPEHPALPRLVRGLLAARRDGHFATTQESAWALLALDEVSRGSPATATVSGRAWLDDDPVLEATLLGPGPRGAHTELPLARLRAAPGGRLTFTSDGGPLYYQGLLRLERSALAATPAGHGLWLERALSPAGYAAERRPPSTTFHVGDWVEVSALVTSPVPREQVVVVLPLPAGLEAVNPLQATTARLPPPPFDRGLFVPHRELHDDRVELFVEALPAGTSFVAALARATVAGDYVTPPATAECMYATDVRAHTGAVTVHVQAPGSSSAPVPSAPRRAGTDPRR